MKDNKKAPVAVTKFLKVVFFPVGILSVAVVSIVLAVRYTSLVPLSFMTVENAVAATSTALAHAEQAVYGEK